MVKIALAILMIGCLLDMPYGYFMFVRFCTILGMALLAYFAYEEKRMVELIIFICIGLLFQPFSKIPLGRELWNSVDVVVAIGLVGSIFLTRLKDEKR